MMYADAACLSSPNLFIISLCSLELVAPFGSTVREIITTIENAADRCEDAADVLRSIALLD
jgi:hypothetical protein